MAKQAALRCSNLVEFNNVSIDIFMCGSTRPELAVEELTKAFSPESVSIVKHLRGATLAH